MLQFLNLFSKPNLNTMAKKNDIPSLLTVLQEELSESKSRRELERIRNAWPKPIENNAFQELFARKELALTLLCDLIRQNRNKGQTIASQGWTQDLRNAIQHICCTKDEELAKATALSLYPLNDTECNQAIAEMLVSQSVGSQLWIDMCRTQDPKVLHILLPAIPRIQQTPQGIYDTAFEWLKYPVKSSVADEKYPCEFLISLLFDLKVRQKYIQELLSELLRPKTARDQILAQLLKATPDNTIIDGIRENIDQILVEFLKAAPIEYGVSAKAATVLLRRGFSPACAEEKVFFHLALRSSDFDERICQIGDSAGQILLPLANSGYWFLVYRALARLHYEPSVLPILERIAAEIRGSRRDSMWTPQYGTVAYVDTELNKSAKNRFIEAATLYGDCARQTLKRFQQDKHIDVADVAKSALKQISEAKK